MISSSGTGSGFSRRIVFGMATPACEGELHQYIASRDRDRQFESAFLQRRVCEPSVPVGRVAHQKFQAATPVLGPSQYVAVAMKSRYQFGICEISGFFDGEYYPNALNREFMRACYPEVKTE